MSVTTYQWPSQLCESRDFTVTVNGMPVFVHEMKSAAFAIFDFSGEAAISVQTANEIKKATVRPQKWNTAKVQGRGLEMVLQAPAKLSVEFDGLKPLFLFADSPETEIPDRNDPSLHFYAAGKIYDAGEIHLQNGETLYIEGGAVVRGIIRTQNAERVCVKGRGILDGAFSKGAAENTKFAVFDHCRDLHVEGITMIDPASWMLVLGACDRVVVRGIKQIGEVCCSDGVDIVGSQNVLIEDCFFRNNDDCIAVKAIETTAAPQGATYDWRCDVRNVLVQRCVMLNAQCGNALEIGFETRTGSISDITFRNCDIIAAHGDGGVFTIHNGDRATVCDVTYEDIRVEHFYDKLIDFRILHSRYSRDADRGRIRNVRFQKIRTIQDHYNTPSLIGGMDAAHTIENVIFEDFVMGECKVESADALNLYTKHADGIRFC